MNKKVKVAVGLSGGVDSSVAAALLKNQGYEVIGISMATYDGSLDSVTASGHACFGPDEAEDMESARAVCRHLGIPFHVIDLKKEFRDLVLTYFRQEYLKGRTPNPCIVCNHRLKFGFLLEKARSAGLSFDYFATGHYARVAQADDRYLLKKAADRSKDQTYFLYTLKQKDLARILFPLGDYLKPEVRELARGFGLSSSERPESQDFISGGDYTPLFTPQEVMAGEIVDEKETVLGRHQGIVHYTIGQRKGLGIAASRPLYVKQIDAVKNRIVVGEKEALSTTQVVVSDVTLTFGDRLENPIRANVKLRLQHPGGDAIIVPKEDGRAELVFDAPQEGIAPGQSAVFYQEETVLGGGIITTP